jgi:UDP-N-acetylglucosamine:LPS N-acetylglucosamine transferase
MAVNGDAADLISQSCGGIVAESENAEELAKAAEQLASLSPEQLKKMGDSAQGFYKKHMALSVGVGKFGTIFKQLAPKEQTK